MNPAQTQLSIRATVVPCYVRGQANTAQIEVERSATDITLTSATYSLYDVGGTVVVDAASATVAAGTATYALTTGHLPASTTPAAGWQERWSLVYGGQTYAYDREVVIGRRAMSCPISDTDIRGRFERLAGQATDRNTWQDKIDEAWVTTLSRLIATNLWPNRILSPSALRPIVLAQVLVLIFEDLASQQPNRGNFLDLAKAYKDDLRNAWADVTAALDSDEDGVDDSGGLGRQPLSTGVMLRTAPPVGFSPSSLSLRGF